MIKSKKKLKKDRKKSWQIMQTHHLEYDPEITVRLTRTEHFFCGRMDSYGKARGFTEGFIHALQYMSEKYKGVQCKSLEEKI